MFALLEDQVGAGIVARELFGGRIWAARPLHLLAIEGDVLVVHFTQGSTWLYPERPDGSEHRLPEDPWTLQMDAWPYDNLWFVPAGQPFAVHTLRRGPDEELLGWYVNVQEPIRASSAGFDYLDHTLDVIAAPDLSSWQLKDEDELAVGVQRGLYSHADAAAIETAADAGVAWLQDHLMELQRWARDGQVRRAPLHLDETGRLVV